MTTKQLTYAAELARTQNFNRAAENLFISQPTLTYQIILFHKLCDLQTEIAAAEMRAAYKAGSKNVAAMIQEIQDRYDHSRRKGLCPPSPCTEDIALILFKCLFNFVSTSDSLCDTEAPLSPPCSGTAA